MPAYSDVTTVIDRQLLLQLGDRLKRTRLSQGLSATAMAQRVGISRTTLSSVESGDPTPTMGTYLRVMSALGVAGDLALLGSGALQAGNGGTPGKKITKRPPNTLRVEVGAGDSQHEVQDLQSLMLHKEAVRLLSKHPELIQRALKTLDNWRAKGNTRSSFLWDEWAVILHRKSWRKALAQTRRAKELRQASPLPTILPPEVRQDVLDQVRALRRGLVLGNGSPVRADEAVVTGTHAA